MLPMGKLGRATVALSGGEAEVHSMTLAQSRIAGNLDGDERIIAAISFGTATDKNDVRAWLETAPAGDVTKLLDAITEVSGLSGAATFPE